MTSRPVDREGAEINQIWKLQQAAKAKSQNGTLNTTALSQTPTETPASVPIVANNPDSQTSLPHPVKPQSPTPAECRDCPVRTGCKAALKLWHKKTPRTGLWRAWNDLIEKNKALMVCLKGDSKP